MQELLSHTASRSMNCLVVKDDDGNIVSVSEAMEEDEIEEYKENLNSTGVKEENMWIVSRASGRRLKSGMTK